MANHLTLAVAGSRKTQGIVDYCASVPTDRRILVLTYTQTNQAELLRRIATYAGDRSNLSVAGWFAFLLRDFVRPFLPCKFPGQRVLGFNFEGRPPMMAKGLKRFLDSNGAVYKEQLSRLACELVKDSQGALVRRLECIYDEIVVDEVQDLSGYDWDIVDVLLASSVDLRMVGDVRQSVLSTNPRSAKNKQYGYAEVIKWFRDREAKGILKIVESATTWRCSPGIAAFSDSIFDAAWSFPPTQSRNEVLTGHDGVFLVRREDVDEYIATFRPRCLRVGANSGKEFNLEFLNFGVAKGMTFERVLIVPTEGIRKFVQSGIFLGPRAAASFYVGVTRAAQSVAIVIDNPGRSKLRYWKPGGSASEANHERSEEELTDLTSA